MPIDLSISDATLRYAEEVTTALLGLDALYRAEAGDGEGLAVLNMAAGLYAAEPFGSYDEAALRFEELARLAGGLPEADRRQYYGQLCSSSLAFIEWRARGLPFREQLGRFLHVPVAPASEAELAALRGRLRALLNGMGYGGDLAAQCAAWEARQRVPPDEVPGVLADLMDAAWDRTAERMALPAPKSDGMRVATVSGAAFNARCDYTRRLVELNIDPVLTRPALKHLTVHECYPGHYVQFKLRETWYRQGLAPADGLLSVVNTASSTPFEGIADNGMAVIDWVTTDDDRVSALLGRYRSGIGTAAAWRLHALGQDPAAVADWLRGQALVGGEGWVAGRMRFLAAASRAVLIWSYWWGEPTVAAAWAAVPPERRGDFLRYLYGRMHSPQTVKMFS